MQTLITYLNTIHPVPEELKYHLLKTVKTTRVGKKGYIVEPGHICHNIYFVQSGIVRHYRVEGGDEITSHIIEENGIIFSTEGICTRSLSTEFIQAIEPTELCYISHNELQHILQRFGEFQHVFWALVLHYNTLREQRDQVLRMRLAQDRFNNLLQIAPNIELRVPNKMLASYIRCTAVSLCRIKKLRY